MKRRLEEPTRWGMVVSDGEEIVAIARKTGVGDWVLRLYGGCWLDPRARAPGVGGIATKYPELMAVPTKREARKILQGLVRQGVDKRK